MHLKDILKSGKVASGYVYVSTNNTFDAGLQTMVFQCDKSGEVTDWSELDSDGYVSESQAESGHKTIVAKWGALAHFD